MNNEGAAALSPLVFVLAGVGLCLVLWVASVMNRRVHLRNLVRESWSDVDVALKRRHDLIPNLVKMVKSYAQYEQETLAQIVKAREDALASVGRLVALGESESRLESALHTFLARVEAYPELRADQHFLKLQEELTMTEDRIAAARRLYNANVRELNTLVESFPSSLLIGNTPRADYFELNDPSERAVPPV